MGYYVVVLSTAIIAGAFMITGAIKEMTQVISGEGEYFRYDD